MSSPRRFFHFTLNIILAFAAFHFSTPNALSISSPEEYLEHTRGSDNCVTEQCHPRLTDAKAFEHAPVRDKKCSACHRAEAYPERLGLDSDQRISCLGCHKNLASRIQSSHVLHGPVKNGDCTSCHDPHGTALPGLLRDSSRKLCSLCHRLEALYSGAFIHKPVEDGNCGLCHDPHASNVRFRLTDVGANLCLTCHEDMMHGMTGEQVHQPLITSGCSDCHDPHSGDNRLRLRRPQTELCFECHDEKKNEISHYSQNHGPALEGKCTACHSPHFSERQNLLLEEIDALCYKCHTDNRVWKTRRFKHGPVAQGNCVACHNPHGSDNAFILRLAFPYKFYTPYEKDTYSLCFLCHKEALITVEETGTVTSFRNGDKNLHAFHVKQKKGRTCRACHDIHASDIEHHLREEVMFGSYSIPIEYFKTSTGGRCIPGCHKERAYDRVNAVRNKN
jgi:predicted CXXCH cytochrome family protein